MKKRSKITTNQPPIISMPVGKIDIPEGSVLNIKNSEENIKTVEKILPKSTFKISNSVKTKQNDQIEEEVIKYQNLDTDDIKKEQGWQKPTFVLDQQLPICKDYMMTGFCNFGWSCKFFHTRDRTLTAFQLDRVTEQNRLKEARDETKNSQNVIEEFHICSICKKFYNNPVILKCGHIFCQKCAMERYKNDKTCFVCGKGFIYE